MKENDFEEWLINEYVTRNGGRLQKRPRSDAKSRCKRVEKYEGDLDAHFERDKMRSLLDSLAYSKNDHEAGISPCHSIPIDGNIQNGTASLRNAIKLYYQFCIDNQ
jgi:hypothetical protein